MTKNKKEFEEVEIQNEFNDDETISENVEELEIQNDETISENTENVEETQEVEENEEKGIKTL